MNPTIKGVIADVVQTGGLTLPIARQLTTDPDRNRALILNIAFRVACQLGSTVNPTDLLAQVGVSLSHTVTTLLSSDTDKKSRKIPGIEML